MDGSCAGKVAVVFGATRGIGRSTALALAEASATVVVTGRSRDNAEKVAAEVAERSSEAYVLPFDIADTDASVAAIDMILARYGRLDIAVANAGINPYFVRAEDLTPQEWDHVIAVNLRGLFFAIQAAARPMLKQRQGSIVSVSSVTAVKGSPRTLPYSAGKGGLDAITRTLSVEWADRNVRVNAVAPGYIETDLTEGMRRNPSLRKMLLDKTPLRRFGTPEEVAQLIVFLSSDASSYTTGQTFLVDGGYAAA